MAAYTLKFTLAETDAIDFVGYRYSWSNALQTLLSYDDDGQPVPIELDADAALYLVLAFIDDTEGGYSMFPMLDPNSELARKLNAFLERIV